MREAPALFSRGSFWVVLRLSRTQLLRFTANLKVELSDLRCPRLLLDASAGGPLKPSVGLSGVVPDS